MLLPRCLTAFLVGQSFTNGRAAASERSGFVQESSEPNAQRGGSEGSPSLEVSWDTIADRTIPRILGWVILTTYVVIISIVVSSTAQHMSCYCRLLACLGIVYIAYVCDGQRFGPSQYGRAVRKPQKITRKIGIPIVAGNIMPI